MNSEFKKYLVESMNDIQSLDAPIEYKSEKLLKSLSTKEISKCDFVKDDAGRVSLNILSNVTKQQRHFVMGILSKNLKSTVSLAKLSSKEKVVFYKDMLAWAKENKVVSSLADLGIEKDVGISNTDLGKDTLKVIRDTHADIIKRVNKIKNSLYEMHEDNKERYKDKLEALLNENEDDGKILKKAISILDNKIENVDSSLDYYLNASNDFYILLHKKVALNNIEDKKDEDEEDDYEEEDYEEESSEEDEENAEENAEEKSSEDDTDRETADDHEDGGRTDNDRRSSKKSKRIDKGNDKSNKKFDKKAKNW